MPEFIDIATWFDDTDLYDGYSNQYLFRGQFGTFDEAAIDGTTSKRRTLSLHPDLTIPPRRVLTVIGGKWIVGDGTSDAFQNVTVRTTYWLKRVTDVGQALTPAQVCNSAAGVDLCLHRVFLQNTINTVTDAQYDQFYNVFMNLAEMPTKNSYIRIGSEFLRVRESHRDINGMGLASCDSLDAVALVPVTLANSGVYDPISDSYTGGTTVVDGIFFNLYKAFEYSSQADAKMLAGDMSLVLAVELQVGQSLAIAGAGWRVQNKVAELDGWKYHIRRQ